MKHILKVVLIAVMFANVAQAKEKWEAFGVNWKTATVEDVKDIDVSLQDDKQRTPLYYATKYNSSIGVASILVQNDIFSYSSLEEVKAFFNTPFSDIKGTVLSKLMTEERDSIEDQMLVFATTSNENFGVTQYLLDIFEIDLNTLYAGKNYFLEKFLEDNSNPESVKELFVNIKFKDDLGNTALYYSIALNKDLKFVQALIGENIQDYHGNTVLHYAVAYDKDLKFIQALVDAGAAIDKKNNDGKTPLHYVSSEKTMNFLVDRILGDKESLKDYQSLVNDLSDSVLYRDIVKKISKKMHALAFKDAESKNTIEAYNEFIITYPNALEVSEANKKAYKLEKSKYSGWFSNDEKNSRALYIKINQINKQKNNSNIHRGYDLVIQRMGNLLQDLFPAELATMNFVESPMNVSSSAKVESLMTDTPHEVPLITKAYLNEYGSAHMPRLKQISNQHSTDIHFRVLPILEKIKANNNRVSSGKFSFDNIYSEISYQTNNGDIFRSYDFTDDSEQISQKPNWVEKMPTKKYKKIRVDGEEFNSLPNHDLSKAIFIKKNDEGSSSIFIKDLKTQAIIKEINYPSALEKCVWSSNNNDFYCAIPRSGDFDVNRWRNTSVRKQSGYFSRDDIMKFNSKKGGAEIYFDSIIEGKYFDIADLKIDNREKYLFWINKRSGFAWSYDMYY